MTDDSRGSVRLPAAPAVVAGVRAVAWRTAEGEIDLLSRDEAAQRLGRGVVPIVCHAPMNARRLGVGAFPAFDVLELFAFVRPARFSVPTPTGLARVLGLPPPEGAAAEAASLPKLTAALLAELAATREPKDALAVARAMAEGGWPWAPAVIAALGGDPGRARTGPGDGLDVWTRLEPWEESAPEPPPDNQPVDAEEARTRLAGLLGPGAEDRRAQKAYAGAIAAAFAPRQRLGEPLVVLAEAGTGVGKTLGYLAPASVWAEKNRGAVWISTYTRNLQRQLDQELDRLYPDPALKARRAVVRKGRENYLCLLNFEDAVRRGQGRGSPNAVALGLMARWAAASRDGDMVGGDFPAWLVDLLGRAATLELTDTRGECVYSACRHYRKCFNERTARRARRADVVVANHALVMVQAALGGGDEAAGAFLPTRFVFDEGHHLFEAADAAFSAHLTGREAEDLRRWLLGAERRPRSRARGLRERIGDLVADDAGAAEALEESLRAARALPGQGWLQRLVQGLPTGPAEAFLGGVREQVYARADAVDGPYGIETEAHPPANGLIAAALALEVALARLARPLIALAGALEAHLDREGERLESESRLRLEAVRRGLERRGVQTIQAWRAMLQALSGETPAEFVDWFGVERADGRDTDVGFHRHWVDPTRPLSATLRAPAHGIVVTSATLADSSGFIEAVWAAAEARTGARYFPAPAARFAAPSPFDYPSLTRVFVVTDVARDRPEQVAGAYRELFLAAGGGGLGLFTAVSRLRAVHARIAEPLEAAGIALLAQHVDPLDVGTLIDMFRADPNSCLLGTDAVRDGIDVPGRSLRLIVFDRVPWHRPDILHRVRRDAFGGRAYDEMLTRFRLKQAFGRLVRRGDDRGVFVMLDRALPSRLATAFPDGVAPARVGLAEAVGAIRAFLAAPGP